MYHGLGKGWRLASPRLSPLPGGRAGPLLGFPAAKRVKSGASKSVNSGSLLLDEERKLAVLYPFAYENVDEQLGLVPNESGTALTSKSPQKSDDNSTNR